MSSYIVKYTWWHKQEEFYFLTLWNKDRRLRPPNARANMTCEGVYLWSFTDTTLVLHCLVATTRLAVSHAEHAINTPSAARFRDMAAAILNDAIRSGNGAQNH